ncbi:cardiolipin synthase [Bacillus sp. MUM 116]|uniref:cardiolipin synthase n=1 Tax=Bacillus sp. MUM 116 TaxID=1678002 RepID=UPI0008F5E5BF|nr:cardiolipin synthase [Bacillus sp. MUM 116]OIK16074.1 cardiolipin synthase [Bacillus sp. MUM 116]
MKFALVLIGVLLLIIIWLVLDFRLGRKKHLSQVKNLESPMLHGQLDIFPHGPELFADYFKEIKAAKQHVHILFYIVKNDAFSLEFLQLLKEKAREGVEVRLLLDRIGGIYLKKSSINELREAGIHFSYSNRVKLPYLFYSAQVRNHRKITIIDGKIGYLGGYNIGREYINEDPKLSPWRDYHLKLLGEGATFLQSEFLIDWRENTDENLLGRSNYFPDVPKGLIRHQFMPTEAVTLEGKYVRLIQMASESMIIGTPYFIPSKLLFHELIGALRRGVQLTIVVPYTSDHILVQEASHHYLKVLIREGAKVFQFKNGFYHAKTIVIDDKLCDIGTANFDKRSLFLNKEINCYIFNPEFIRRLKSVLQKDIDDSRPLTLADLTKPNLFRSIKEGIAGIFSYFL